MKKYLFLLLFATVASIGTASAAITVRLNPVSCSTWSTVRLWAWTDNGNIFDAWPGQIVSTDADGWYSYTFDASITSVSIIWNNGTYQTVDIEGVTSSTCYALNSTSGTAIKVSVVDCSSGSSQGETPVSGKYKIGDLYYNLDATNQTAEVTYKSYTNKYNEGWGITTANIPASVEYNSVTYSVTSIGANAFNGCYSLASASIPNSVTSIGNSAFVNCYSLASASIPNSVTSIGNRAFVNCNGLTSVTIPNSVTSIGEYAFSGCSGLTSVTIPNSVTSIGWRAFHNCSGLTSVTIGSGVTSIGANAFYGCTGLTSITIPNSVTSIGEYAFLECDSLTSIVVESGNTQYDSRNNCNAIVETATNTLIVGCKNTIIPNSVISIEEGAFDRVVGLTSVTIPNSVTSIGASAFHGCTGLTSISIPNSVTSMGSMAFSGCRSLPIQDNIRYADTYLVEVADKTLSKYTIKYGTRWIGGYAFYECSGLTSVEIPNSVTSIEYYAFYNCTGLTSVTCLGEIPASITSDVFENCDNLSSIYVPCGTLETYKSEWSKYSGFIRYAPMPYRIIGQVNDNSMGKVQISGCDNIGTLTAIANKGYYFVQWNDGVTDNPRTIELTQDTTFTAEFAPSNKIMTCSEARNAALNGSTEYVTVIGYVTEIATAWHATYNNISFWMADTQNGGRVFEAFRVKCATQEEAPRVGDKVKVHGNLSVYNQTTPELAEGGTFEILERASVDPTTAIDRTLNEQAPTKVMRNGQLFILRGEELYNAQGARVR